MPQIGAGLWKNIWLNLRFNDTGNQMMPVYPANYIYANEDDNWWSADKAKLLASENSSGSISPIVVICPCRWHITGCRLVYLTLDSKGWYQQTFRSPLALRRVVKQTCALLFANIVRLW